MIQLGLFLKDHVTLKTGERDNAQNSQRDFTITVRSYLNKQTQLWCTEEIYQIAVGYFQQNCFTYLQDIGELQSSR